MFDLSIAWWEIVLRTVVVYAAVLALLRLGGKRELGQMTPFDLVVIIVIANAVQNSMNGGDTSLVGGLIAAATLVLANAMVARLGRRFPGLQRVLEDEPTLILQDGTPLAEAMKREGVTRDELEMAAREHGIADLGELSAAILEADGSISVIPAKGGSIHRGSRRLLRRRKAGL